MSIFNFFKMNKQQSDIDHTVKKLIQCTELTVNEIIQLVEIKKQREEELYIFSQWITMNSAIIYKVNPKLMESYYMNHDYKWIRKRDLPMEYGVKISEIREKRFNEYNEFQDVIKALFGGKYDTSFIMKFVRVVFTNFFGVEANKHLLSSGPELPIKIQEVILQHGEILE